MPSYMTILSVSAPLSPLVSWGLELEELNDRAVTGHWTGKEGASFLEIDSWTCGLKEGQTEGA